MYWNLKYDSRICKHCQFSVSITYNVIHLYLSFHFHTGWFMVFNATFNYISAISRRLVLLVGETGVLGENHRPVASH